MASYTYATAVDKAKQAQTVALNQPVSTKQSLEIARWLRGRSTEKAKVLLQAVIEKRIAVPYKRFNKKIAHKKQIGPGKYPVKTASLFLKLINEVEANASVKGLNEEALKIHAIVVHKGARNMHHGRQRGRTFKNAHIEIVVEETEKRREPKKAAPKKAAEKAEPKKAEAQKPEPAKAAAQPKEGPTSSKKEADEAAVPKKESAPKKTETKEPAKQEDGENSVSEKPKSEPASEKKDPQQQKSESKESKKEVPESQSKDGDTQ